MELAVVDPSREEPWCVVVAEEDEEERGGNGGEKCSLKQKQKHTIGSRPWEKFCYSPLSFFFASILLADLHYGIYFVWWLCRSFLSYRQRLMPGLNTM
jgi:hypothetical protein